MVILMSINNHKDVKLKGLHIESQYRQRPPSSPPRDFPNDKHFAHALSSRSGINSAMLRSEMPNRVGLARQVAFSYALGSLNPVDTLLSRPTYLEKIAEVVRCVQHAWKEESRLGTRPNEEVASSL